MLKVVTKEKKLLILKPESLTDIDIFSSNLGRFYKTFFYVDVSTK
jgi:hypothetical protein